MVTIEQKLSTSIKRIFRKLNNVAVSDSSVRLQY